MVQNKKVPEKSTKSYVKKKNDIKEKGKKLSHSSKVSRENKESPSLTIKSCSQKQQKKEGRNYLRDAEKNR